MTDSIAARVYAAYAAALGEEFPKFMDRPDKGAPWFAVVSARAQIVADPTDVSDPSTFELSKPIAPRRICDLPGNNESTEIFMEEIPTSLAIRPLVADDLCRREFAASGARFWHAIACHVHEVDTDMLAWRVDVADAKAAERFVLEAAGADADDLMRDAYLDAGGEPRDDSAAWMSAAFALLVVDGGDHYVVTCRTAGLGDLQVGPLRPGHLIIHQEVSERSTEWGGRLAALAKATGAQLEHLHAARVEDVQRLWLCFEELKKKAEEGTRLLRAARRSITSIQDGPAQKSEGLRSAS